MKRIGLSLTLFTVAFLFTQCKDECEDYTGCGCGGSSSSLSIVGLTDFDTRFNSYDGNPEIALFADHVYAARQESFSLFNTAYACQPGLYLIDLGQWIDSIQVSSIPIYNSDELVNQLKTKHLEADNFTLDEFNSFERRDLTNNINSTIMFEIASKPTQSDSFTFSFYYYKDGAIIDSSSTQKYYISN